MCGRFTATFEFSDIGVRWNLDRNLPDYTPRFNIAPEWIAAANFLPTFAMKRDDMVSLRMRVS
jgi:hypothetical protein